MRQGQSFSFKISKFLLISFFIVLKFTYTKFVRLSLFVTLCSSVTLITVRLFFMSAVFQSAH